MSGIILSQVQAMRFGLSSRDEMVSLVKFGEYQGEEINIEYMIDFKTSEILTLVTEWLRYSQPQNSVEVFKSFEDFRLNALGPSEWIIQDDSTDTSDEIRAGIIEIPQSLDNPPLKITAVKNIETTLRIIHNGEVEYLRNGFSIRKELVSELLNLYDI